MEKFTAFIEKHIAPMANKLGRNKYVVALQNSFFAMIPFITVGGTGTDQSACRLYNHGSWCCTFPHAGMAGIC